MLAALAWLVPHETAAVSAQLLCTSYNQAPIYNVTIRSHIYVYRMYVCIIVQELCESRGGRPGLSVLTSLLVSVDVKNY